MLNEDYIDPNASDEEDKQIAEDEHRWAFQDKFKELDMLSDYPPYSLHENKWKSLNDGMREEENRWKTADDKTRAFSTLEVAQADDLDEARLYQKRYNDPKEAQKAALELNGMTGDEPGVAKFW